MRLIGLAVVLAVGLVLAPIAGEAQQVKVYRVGVLNQDSPRAPGSPPGILTRALRDLGYIEGKNIVLDRRWAEGKNERYSSLATELVALKPDVIVADTTPAVIAAKRATATIPIVMVLASDPVGSGFVESLAHPGGNVTGVTSLETELHVKSVELLHAVVPKATRVAVLMSDNPVHPSQLKAIQDAARGFGLTVLPTMVRSSDDFEEAFRSMAKQKAGALIVLGGSPFNSARGALDKLLKLAAKAKLPAIYRSRNEVEAGGLLSYAANNAKNWSLAATYVDKILKGAKPADLPVQQPTEFELAINLKTAKALGLTIPQSILLRADQVIE
jgi:putative tryptophan/tyrosine transport system substrate-binding protein